MTITFARVDEVGGAPVDATRSPDGRWRLVTTPVRTRKLEEASGDATVVLEGWLQVAPAWISADQLVVLCADGDADLDLADPEIGSLHTLREGFPGPDRVVRVTSSGLLHVLAAGGDYLYHVQVDADHVDADPARGLVVLTRARPGGASRWRTAILAVTPAGLAILAKHSEDIGRLVIDGARLLGANGFELLGVDAALAAAGAWRTTVIEDGIALEPPSPPPPATITVADLTLVRVDGAKAPRPIDLEDVGLDGARYTRAHVHPERARAIVASGGAAWDLDVATGREEPIWRSWPPVISVGRGDDVAWVMLRVHRALCELIRLVRADAGWRATTHLPVEGFDRLHLAARGRLVVVTIDNAPPEMAWSRFVAVDDDGVLRDLGLVHHVVTAAWDDGGVAHVELLGGHVYRVDGVTAAVIAAKAAEPRPLRALVYDVPGSYGHREFLARHDADIGFVDRTGALVIDPQFTSAGDFAGGVVAAAHAGPRLFGLVDRDGALVVPHHHSWIGEPRGGCRRIARGEPDVCGDPPASATWGLLGDDGALVLAPDAVSVLDMAEGRAAVERVAGRWNLVGRDGAMLLDDDADGCGSFGDGLCPVRRGDRWGYVDRDGAWAIAPRFARATDFAGGLAAVLEDEAWRLLTCDGALVGDRCEDLGALRDGLVRVQRDGRWGFLDAAGAVVVAPRFEQAFDFHDGWASVRLGDAWTWVDRAGRLLAEPGFDRAFDFHGGVGIFRRGARYGFVAASGDVIADGFEDAGAFIEDRAAVCQRARWGFLDRTGALVIRPRYTQVLAFSEGLAAVRSAGAWGFVDATGAPVIPPTLGTCGSFHDGRARVSRR